MIDGASSGAFEGRLAGTAAEVVAALEMLLPKPEGAQARLLEAMRYAVLGPAKRFRAFLVMSCGTIFNQASDSSIRVAASVECLHAYARVHDDLPALDNSAMRLGRPATHVAYDEATAILAGDALLTFAFETLIAPETHPDPFLRAELVLEMAQAVGAHGLVGGQMIDVQVPDAPLPVGAVLRLQRLKTGSLFAFCCTAGAILARAPLAQRQSLHAFAHALGLAYQMADDLMDGTWGLDRPRPNFLKLLGEERARGQARLLAEQAICYLDSFDSRADPLRAAALYAVARAD